MQQLCNKIIVSLDLILDKSDIKFTNLLIIYKHLSLAELKSESTDLSIRKTSGPESPSSVSNMSAISSMSALSILTHAASTSCVTSVSPSMVLSSGAMSPMSDIVAYNASTIKYKYSCKHCKAFTTYNITEIIYHGKTCTYMLRPNLYKFKYVCYECNFGAYQIAHLKRHIYTHTGEKPYNCLYCAYSSTHKYNIQKHVKVHTSKCEKHFPCLYCKMKFDTSFDLLKHMTCVHSTFSLDCSKSASNIV